MEAKSRQLLSRIVGYGAGAVFILTGIFAVLAVGRWLDGASKMLLGVGIVLIYVPAPSHHRVRNLGAVLAVLSAIGMTILTLRHHR